MRRKQDLLYRERAIRVGLMMFVAGLIFVCYMGSSLIRSTQRYKHQTLQIAQTQ